jgi:hypothetical protein
MDIIALLLFVIGVAMIISTIATAANTSRTAQLLQSNTEVLQGIAKQVEYLADLQHKRAGKEDGTVPLQRPQEKGSQSKATPMQPMANLGALMCPTCKVVVNPLQQVCPNCGQRLDWKAGSIR